MNALGASLLRPGIFRLFLAAMVVLHHSRLVALGAWAVDVFFVLSGYWVCRMWREKYRPRPRATRIFLASRFWRLLPVYLVCQLIGLAVLMRFSPRWSAEAAIMQDSWWIARTAAIVSSGSQFNFLPPIWTLDIEMQFYLALPALAWVLAAVFRWSKAARLTTLAVAGAGLAWLFLRQSPGQPALRLLTPYLIFFGAGMCIYFSGWKPTLRAGLASAALVALMLAVTLCHPDWRELLGSEATRTANPELQHLNTLFCGALALLAAPYAALTLEYPSPPLDRHFGNLSYVLYLIHYPIQMCLDWAGPSISASPLILGALQIAAIITSALVLYVCIDVPSEHWRRHFLEKKGAVAPPNPS